jgi:PIN domain nuclease of toxin-antitoxin system
MRALLDTHAFLWFNMNDPRLSEVARNLIADGRNEIFLSAASAWEIAIKVGRGRLTLPEPPDRYVGSRITEYRIQPMPILLSHAVAVFRLPDIHRDPFDRLLIAQSRLEEIPLITGDEYIRKYDIATIW